MTPEKILSGIKREYCNTFLMAFAMGLVVHGYRLANHLLTWDSAFNFHDPQVKTALGRCFLSIGCAFTSFYDIQWITGLVSLAYLAVICVILCEIFAIRSSISRFLTCGIVMCFPSVASTFAYMYTADGYMLAGLLAAVAAYLMIRYTADRSLSIKRLIIPAGLLALSVGMYQAYLAYGVVIVMAWGVLELLYSRGGTGAADADTEAADSVDEPLAVFRRLAVMAGTVVTGVIIYYICNTLIAVMTGTVMEDYNGISGRERVGIITRITGWIRNSVIDTFYFLFGPASKVSVFQILNVLLALLLLIFLVQRIRSLTEPSATIRISGALVVLLLMPFAAFAIYLISPSVRYYMLMYAPLQLIYLMPVVIYERTLRDKAGVSLIPVVLSLFIVFNFALVDNVSYLYLRADNEKTLQFTGRMALRLEGLPDFPDAKTLCTVGHLEDYDRIDLQIPPAMAGIRDGVLLSDSAHFTAVLDDYFGIELTPLSKEEAEVLSADPEVVSMPVYPASGSIIQRGTLIIIKLS